jgi:hypothetical protein
MWRSGAPAAFKKAPPYAPQQERFLKTAAPYGSREHDLLDDYVNGGESLWFNNYLRGINIDKLSENARKEYKVKTKTLNKLIGNAPRARQNVVLFRAISQDAPRFQSYKTGDDADFLNKGFVSTSISYDAAASFLEADETCCMLVMLVPKGSRVLEVFDYSAWSEESEVLLPHGSQFKIVHSTAIKGVTTYYCILTAQEQVAFVAPPSQLRRRTGKG